MSWDAIKHVTGWFSLLAFIVFFILYYFRYKAKQQVEMLKASPDKDKSKVVDKLLGRFDVKTERLSKEQQYNLALAQIQSSDRKYMRGILLAGSISVLFFAVWLVSLLLNPRDVSTVKPVLESSPSVSTSPTQTKEAEQKTQATIAPKIKSQRSKNQINQSMRNSPGGIQAGGDVTIGSDAKKNQ
jgi:hypothetical protein